MTRALPSLILFATLTAAAAEAPTIVVDDIRGCLDRLDSSEVSAGDVVLSCPGIDELIKASGWSESLPPIWREQSTGIMLQDLLSLLATYSDEVTATPGPDPGSLDAILTELGEDPEAPRSVSLWAEFRDWCKEILDRFFPGLWDSIRERFERISISVPVVEGLGWAALGLFGLALAALIAAVIAYARKHYHSARKQPADSNELATRNEQSALISLAQIDALGLAERPRLLLRYLLQEIDRKQLLPYAARLTHRELAAAAPFAGSDEIRAFEHVVRFAERVTFGIWQPDRPEFEAALDDGRLLLRSLDGDSP